MPRICISLRYRKTKECGENVSQENVIHKFKEVRSFHARAKVRLGLAWREKKNSKESRENGL